MDRNSSNSNNSRNVMETSRINIFEAAARAGAKEEHLKRLNRGEIGRFSKGVNIVRSSTLKAKNLARCLRALPGGEGVVMTACYMIGSQSDSELKSLFNDLEQCEKREEHFLVVKKSLGKRTQDAISKADASIAGAQNSRNGPPAAMKTVIVQILGHVTDILTTYASDQLRQEIVLLEDGLREKNDIIQEQRAEINRLRDIRL